MISVDLEGFIKKGDKCFENGDYEKAMEYYEEAINIEQKCAEAWYKKGNVLSRIEEDEKALEAYENATKIKPTFAEALYEKGNILNNLRRYEKALKAYKKVTAIKSGNGEYAEAWYKIGNILGGLKREKEALKAYEKAIQIFKEKLKIYGKAIRILKGEVKDEKVIKKFENETKICEEIVKILKGEVKDEKVIKKFENETNEIKLTCAKTWHEKGDIHNNLNEDKKALQAYGKAVRFYDKITDRDSDDDEILKRRKIVSENQKNYRTLKICEKKLMKYEKNPVKKWEYARIRYNIGNILYDLGRYGDSLEAYGGVIKVFEGSDDEEKTKEKKVYIEAWHSKGIVLGHLKRYEEALEAFEKAIEMDSKHFRAWYNKGVAFFYLKKYKNSLKSFKKAIRVFEHELEADEENKEIKLRYIEAYYDKGVILYSLKRYRKALEAFEKAIEINPGYADAWSGKGAAFHDLKRYGKALEAYEKAIEINPKYVHPYIGLGKLFFEQGDLGRASDKVEKALEIDEKNAHALSLKGRIKIEEEKYDQAINLFKRAAFPEVGDPEPLLWAAYTRYLRAEFSSTEDKADEETSIVNKAIKKEIFTAIRELEKARDLSEKHPNRELRECILYFLGYFYYKSNDIFTAKERLEECTKMESRWKKVDEFFSPLPWREYLKKAFCPISWVKGLWEIITSELQREKLKRFITAKSRTERRARELLNHIWKYKLKPAWWRRWWSSPVHRWLKRTIFLLLLLPILSFLFYPFVPEGIYITKENLFVYIMLVPSSVFSIKENLDVYAALVSISIFFLLLPSIEKIRAKEIDVEMSSPPSFEPFISPSMIEEKIGELS